MKRILLCLGLFLCSGVLLAQDLEGELPKSAYADFSKLLHKMVVPQVPRFFEDSSGWGGSIPVPPDLRFPKLRTYIKVGDRIEVPHGIWKKFRIWVDDPSKDVRVELRDFKKTKDGGFRLQIDVDALGHGAAEVKPWQKGLGLPAVTGEADFVVGLKLDVDVKLTLDTSKFPPDVGVEPWIVSSKLELKEINLKRIGSIISIEGEPAFNLGNDMKGLVNSLLQQYEDDITDRVNVGISESLKKGKGALSTGDLLKVFTGSGK